ncbi:unnamed protein product [Arabis nemorensis]|uniref:Uncharacterized protein n=1 Tax=Arabis nemorensis TaxID=586526 RepID=A0A565CC83_9BRAS|nr:unnamed protein product [Arabis nemorensis]
MQILGGKETAAVELRELDGGRRRQKAGFPARQKAEETDLDLQGELNADSRRQRNGGD